MIDVPPAPARTKSGRLPVDQTNDALIAGLWSNYGRNEPQLRLTSWALGAMGILVVGEIVALFLDLAVA